MKGIDKYNLYAERVRIFNGLSGEDVGSIMHHGKVMEYSAGMTIFHEGTLGSSIFIVLKGEVGIFHRNEEIARCVVGDAFGEMSVLNHTPRCATATAVTNARCFTIEEKEIQALLSKQIAVTLLMNIIHVLSERLETANGVNTQLRKQVKTLNA